jgi:hypothetical protein
MYSREFWIPVVIGVIAAPICYLLALFLSVGGLNHYPVILFYPYSMLLGLLMPKIVSVIWLPIIVLQFPLYGVAVGAASVKDGFRPLAIGLAIGHFLALMLGIVIEYTQHM